MPVMLIEWVRTKRHTLLGRFTLRVLLPAFILLLLLSGVIFWLYSQAQREQALEELNTAAETTAIRLEREIALRRTVLTSTGTEIFKIKQDYEKQRSRLKTQREKCRRHYRDDNTDNEERTDACKPFAEELAALPPESRDQLKAIEKGYADQMKTLNESEAADTEQRLDVFSDFFPETLTLMIVNKEGERVSTARAEADNVDNDEALLDALHSFAKKARKTPFQGASPDNVSRQAVFAYPIDGGAALASFDLDHGQFLQPSVAEAPLDQKTSRVLIARPGDGVIYPEAAMPLLHKNNKKIASNSMFRFNDEGITRSGVSANIKNTEWYAVATSPQALVFAPLRDAQILMFILLGGVLITLLWGGTLYIRRLTRSIRRLTLGARAFSGGKLDYRIKLENANTEFQQLAETMNTMAARISEAREEIDRRNKEFIDIATHELKAPITGIIGSLSTVIEDKRYSKFGDKTKKLMNTAYQETIRLRDLISELLNIAKLEGGQTPFEREHVNIEESVNEVINTLSSLAKEKNITLQYEPDETPPTVVADPSKLQVVLTNLVSNAVKYNYENASVYISHTIQENEMITHITDEGFGIPADQQPHMFQKFYRVDSKDHARVSGSGLGLYTTKQYVEGMDGLIWFESEPGNGTAFSFTLPLAD